MSRIFGSKKKRALLGLVASLAIASAAFAYWTTTGSGTGEGDIEAGNNAAVTLAGTLDDDLVPGRTVNLEIDATNADAETNYFVTSSTVDSFDVVEADPNDAGECLESWFVVDSNQPQNQTIEPSATEPLGASHTVEFLNDVDDNQDACKSASIDFVLSSD